MELSSARLRDLWKPKDVRGCSEYYCCNVSQGVLTGPDGLREKRAMARQTDRTKDLTLSGKVQFTMMLRISDRYILERLKCLMTLTKYVSSSTKCILRTHF